MNNKALQDKALQIGIDVEMLEEILILFFDKLPQQIKQMDEAMAAKDFEQLHVIAHTIKGTASNLFYEKISTISSAIEQAALAQSCPVCEQQLQELSLELAHIRKILYP